MSRKYIAYETALQKLDMLLPKIIELDDRRWAMGEEWLRGDMPRAKMVIFDNKENLSADARITLIWYCCILDRQARYERVWRDGLNQALEYMRDSGPIPQIRMDESKHFEPTYEALGNRAEGVFAWLVRKVLDESSPSQGNLYRLVGKIGEELLGLPRSKVDDLCKGKPGLLGDWKRLWVFVMLLRRDRSFYKRLIEEAAGEISRGNQFLERWYGEAFPEKESELPVDSRIKDFFKQLDVQSDSLPRLAEIAHAWGSRNGKPPSALDVAFVPRFNEELFKYGLYRGLIWDEWWQDR